MNDKWIKEWTEQMLSEKEETLSESGKDFNNPFDLELFARLQQSFMMATGLNGNVIDMEGQPLTPEFSDRSPSFCRMVHSVPEGRQRCRESDRKATEQAISQEKVAICRCHAGLYDSAVPIHFQQHGLGAFITGQVLLQAPTEKLVADILRRVDDLGLDPQELREAIFEIPQISTEKLHATTEFMKILADYIVKSLEQAEYKRREAEWRSAIRETEMKVIQTKLHPHFLFNILNLISGQALLEDAPQTYATVMHLTRLLRNIVKPTQPLVTLQDEIENLDAYVQLQVLRFEDRVTYHREWDDQLHRDALVPSMTLQIMVENAFRHGVELKEENSSIILRISPVPDRLVIEVEDSGVGMEQTRVDALLQGSGEFNERLSGLAMIRKRCEFHYGQHFSMMIYSRPGEGTIVKLELPLKYDEIKIQYDKL